MKQRKLVVAVLAAVTAFVPLAGSATASEVSTNYIVVLAGSQTESGFALAGTKEAALALVSTAGGQVANDLSRQIGVLVVQSPNGLFRELVAASPLVESVSTDWSWQGVSTATGAPTSHPEGGGPEPSTDPFEPLQWDMAQIRTEQAHAVEAGRRAVDVGILDTGIDATHLDFDDDGIPAGTTNVDCARGRNSIAFLPGGPGLGSPAPCADNHVHGTHVAGTVAAQANGYGIVGVAPNVTLVPVKVCDTTGMCYFSAVVDGITYSGDQKFDVINMSFFVDDDDFQQSTEFKCMDNDVQRTFRLAVERAIQYARNQGVTPVAALGNSDQDLADPQGVDPVTGKPYTNRCDVVPAETEGVIGTMALNRDSVKTTYSNYGFGAVDVAAPGGQGNAQPNGIFSTVPGNLYQWLQGTSMASPHTAGVAALIVSRFGTLGADGDMKMSPQQVENYLQGTTIDIGLAGYDDCYGNGRIDALKAVLHDTARVYEPKPCSEYAQ